MSAACMAPLSVLRSVVGDPSLDLVCRMLLEAPVRPTQMSLDFYVLVFAFTCLLEAPFYFWFTRRILSIVKQFEMRLIVDLAIYPLVTWEFPMVLGSSRLMFGQYVLVAEIFVPMTEAILLRRFYRQRWKRAFGTAIAAIGEPSHWLTVEMDNFRSGFLKRPLKGLVKFVSSDGVFF